jgi:hypothetical protein
VNGQKLCPENEYSNNKYISLRGSIFWHGIFLLIFAKGLFLGILEVTFSMKVRFLTNTWVNCHIYNIHGLWGGRASVLVKILFFCPTCESKMASNFCFTHQFLKPGLNVTSSGPLLDVVIGAFLP